MGNSLSNQMLEPHCTVPQQHNYFILLLTNQSIQTSKPSIPLRQMSRSKSSHFIIIVTVPFLSNLINKQFHVHKRLISLYSHMGGGGVGGYSVIVRKMPAIAQVCDWWNQMSYQQLAKMVQFPQEQAVVRSEVKTLPMTSITKKWHKQKHSGLASCVWSILLWQPTRS